MDLGIAEVRVLLDPYADQPTFDLNFEMREVDIIGIVVGVYRKL